MQQAQQAGDEATTRTFAKVGADMDEMADTLGTGGYGELVELEGVEEWVDVKEDNQLLSECVYVGDATATQKEKEAEEEARAACDWIHVWT